MDQSALLTKTFLSTFNKNMRDRKGDVNWPTLKQFIKEKSKKRRRSERMFVGDGFGRSVKDWRPVIEVPGRVSANTNPGNPRNLADFLRKQSLGGNFSLTSFIAKQLSCISRKFVFSKRRKFDENFISNR